MEAGETVVDATTEAPAAVTITTWEQLDGRLGELRIIKSKLDGVSATFDKRIQAVQEKKSAAAKPFLAEAELLEAAVLAFVAKHKADLGDKKKSRKLVHGTVGFRLTTAKVVFVKGEAAAMAALRARGQTQCVIVEESVSKTECKKLPPHEMKLAGIELKRDEAAFYELTDSPIVEYPDAGGES